MKFSVYQSSRQGGRRYNQDRVAYAYSKEALLLTVADGMGGHLHGEIASQLTVRMLCEIFQKAAHPRLEDPFAFLGDALLAVHNGIGDFAAQHDLADSPRTTCVACIVQDDTAYWAHVGDSRLYLFRGARLLARTRDHSKVQQLFDAGIITEAQMLTHPERNRIYNCLGGMIRPEVELSRPMPLEEGDAVLLCSDGLWGWLSVAEIGALIGGYPIAQAVTHLLNHAEVRGGEDADNLSAIGMTWGGSSMHEQTLAAAFAETEKAVARAQPGREAARVSEEEIERALAELPLLVRKYT
ncbi:MAG: protein phosphatase 2C domain-containing protein [Betaproteobacteria bacterium]|nr:protein phosphatase 2C domain-containing protein [Betaproteobacteria bacterium]